MAEHRGWAIRVTPHQHDDDWVSLVEVWRPQLDQRTHPGRAVPFMRPTDREDEIVTAGVTAAHRYIEPRDD